MAETFGAALKRYIGSGYAAPEAMRAVWHDVRSGRVARPARRRAVFSPGTREPASRREVRAMARAVARRNPRQRAPLFGPGAVDAAWHARQVQSSRLSGLAALSARAAGRIARGDLAVRRLPRRGYCVRLSDGRELCHDSQGYYLVGSGSNPLTRKETGQALLAARDSARLAKRIPSATAPERQDPVARAAHRGWWYGQADAWAQVVRKFGTLRRRPAAYAMRAARITYGPRAALRHNPELTGEQHQVLNTWARYGPRHWLRKVKGGWITELPASVGDFPVVFKTKREALARVDALLLLRSHEWRGVASNPLIRGARLTPEQRAQVLAAFVHRGQAIGPGKAYPSETAWLREHAFYFTTERGRARLSHRRYAQPAFLANRAATVEAFDLEDRRGWEAAIRAVGGLRVSREDRADYAEVPRHLKGYRRGMAPDALAQVVAEERGLRPRDVARALLRAFHGPRRPVARIEDYEAMERAAIQAERPRGESRPRVGVGASTFTLRPRSPFKGAIHTVNPDLWMRWLPPQRQVEIREGLDGPVRKVPVSRDLPAVVSRHPFAWVQVTRANPRPVSPASKLETLRRIVAHHQAMRLGAEGSVDAFTASAILAVHDRLGPENQAKYLAMPVHRMADVAWKLTGPRAGNPRARVNPMSKKDFVAIADQLHGLGLTEGPEAAMAAARALVPALKVGSPRFDEQRFLDYVATGGRRRNPADPARLLAVAHPVYQTRQRVPKWSIPVSPAHVPALLRRRLPHFTKAQHEEHARQHAAAATLAERQYVQLASAALDQYGTQGPLIAGVLREHFPEPVKDELRRLARAETEERDVARAHWQAAGRRVVMPFNPRRRARGRARGRGEINPRGNPYTHTRLVMALTALDQREAQRERTPNIYRLGHYLGAAQDMGAMVAKGATPEAAFADTFVPTRGMHRVARELGLALDVDDRGRWLVRQPRPNPRRPRGRARRAAAIARLPFGVPAYSEATGQVHSLLHDDYTRALQRAEYYRWTAGKRFPSRDPLTGREERGGAFERAERECNKAQARVWLDQAATLRGSMRRQVLPNPPRWRVGERAVIADPVRTAARFWSAQHRGIVGAGGTILPREILDRPATVASVGAGQCGIKRVLLDWGMDAENRSLGIWLDSDQLARANPRHGVAPGTAFRRRRGRPLTVAEQHQLAIAQETLRMPVPMSGVMGGTTKDQARVVIRRLTGIYPFANPRTTSPAHLTRFYDGITEIRGVKGRRFGYRPGTRFKHPFSSRPRAFGVDRAGAARLRRGDVVLRGRRPIYAQLGA